MPCALVVTSVTDVPPPSGTDRCEQERDVLEASKHVGKKQSSNVKNRSHGERVADITL